MQSSAPDHYATLGLDRRCTDAQIRNAYRLLAKQFHPDINHNSPDAMRRTQAINAAYEILSDPAERQAYDREINNPKRPDATPRGVAKIKSNLAQDVFLRLEDFLRGTTCDVRVNDPANSEGPEMYQLAVPAGTAPGTRFRLMRTGPFASGALFLRVKAKPDFRFKVRGSDVRCDLKIKPERAAQGGVEMINGLGGSRLCVTIPRGVGRNEILRVPGEGLPRPRGGRGDLLLRVTYRVMISVMRK